MPASETTPDWDQLYQQRHTPWDKGAPAPPLLEWLAAHPDRIGGKILVPGSGLGHDVRALATESNVLSVVGLDLSPSAVALAGTHPRVGSETHLVGDLFDLAPAHRGAYDWVWEHTCFCAIPPDQREAYVEAVHGALKPGGMLLGVFYLNPYDEEHQPGEGPPHGCSVGELADRFEKSGKFTIEESYVPQMAFPGREGLERTMSMRRLDA